MPRVPLYARLVSSDVTRRLVDWYADSGRRFPWRLSPAVRPVATQEPLHDPYLILVAEVMLQQTGTARVVEKLPMFLATFPTITDLANASTGDLIRAWKGMGYNRRVLNLQRAAREIDSRWNGVMPRSVEELSSLPGIGRYTASAICCFAFGQSVPVVDVNIIRVLGRIFQKLHSDRARVPESTIWRIDTAILPTEEAYRWHQGLMDLGATICTPLRPRCSVCPLERHCLSAHPSVTELFDAKSRSTPEPVILGIPRRIWRGRIVELMRTEQQGARVADVLDRLLAPASEPSDRRLLFDVVGALLADGLLSRQGVIREGSLDENDRISLPGS